MSDRLKGKLIVLYGVNNLGKSVQINEHIIPYLESLNQPAVYVKYADYSIEPTGYLINSVLRPNNKFSELINPWKLTGREMQILQVWNREQKQPELERLLSNGTHVVAEDYIGTGIAWGYAEAFNLDFLEYMNKHLLQPDLAFSFSGGRFFDGIEKGHRHEENSELMNKAIKAHQFLEKRYGWIKIKSDLSREKVFSQIKPFIDSLLKK